MIYIVFQNGQDAQRLFEQLSKAPQPYGKLLYDDKTITVFFMNGMLRICAHCSFLFLLHVSFERLKRVGFYRSFSRTFFYENEEEQQQILQLTYSFIDGERHDYRLGKKMNIPREQLIAQSLHECLHEGVFSF
ncbi:YtxC-like family protein [Anoxybacillus sp. BCO1]|nr:YtxC-like family protein [Anoxybacillus sp. BCO1]